MLYWLRSLSLQFSYCYTRACGRIFYEIDAGIECIDYCTVECTAENHAMIVDNDTEKG